MVDNEKILLIAAGQHPWQRRTSAEKATPSSSDSLAALKKLFGQNYYSPVIG